MVSVLRNIFLAPPENDQNSRLAKVKTDLWTFGAFTGLLYLFHIQETKFVVIILVCRLGSFGIQVGSQEFKELQLQGKISESFVEFRKTKFKDSELIKNAKFIYFAFTMGIGFLSGGLSLLMVQTDSALGENFLISDREIIAFMISLVFAVFIFFNYKIKYKAEAKNIMYTKIYNIGQHPEQRGRDKPIAKH